ncbi:DUF805 domain-containing protein [Micromonospora chokoriensis]|uniref:DUF805 domain-containing protein n=1 Tax=Micromonospora chokoriensis TaxID=356851 RepID=UPI0004C3B623|nr:DUF805 domain-containing protein [Micromonospora chokoriensis]
MSFNAAVKSAFTQYIGFRGRARRSEFWWFALFGALVNVVAAILDGVLGLNFGEDSSIGLIRLIAYLVLLLPALALTVRRLHDTGRTGWWLLIGLVPLVGGIVLFVFYVSDGTYGPNRFGASPKG